MGEEELLQSVLYALHECGVPWVTPDQISVSMSEGGRLSVEAIVLHADEFEQAGGEAIRRTVASGSECFVPAVQRKLLGLGRDEIVHNVSSPQLISVSIDNERSSIDLEGASKILLIAVLLYVLIFSSYAEGMRKAGRKFAAWALEPRHRRRFRFARFYNHQADESESESTPGLVDVVVEQKQLEPAGIVIAEEAADEKRLVPPAEEEEEEPEKEHSVNDLDEGVQLQPKEVASGAEEHMPMTPKRSPDLLPASLAPSARRLDSTSRTTIPRTPLYQVTPSKGYDRAKGIWQVPEGWVSPTSLPPPSSGRYSARTPLSPATSRRSVPRLSPKLSPPGRASIKLSAPRAIPAEVANDVKAPSSTTFDMMSSAAPAAGTGGLGWILRGIRIPFLSAPSPPSSPRAPMDAAAAANPAVGWPLPPCLPFLPPPEPAPAATSGELVCVRTPTSTYRGNEVEPLINGRQLKAYLDVEAARQGGGQARMHGKLVTFRRKVEADGADDNSQTERGRTSSRTLQSKRSARNQSREWSRLFLEPRVYS